MRERLDRFIRKYKELYHRIIDMYNGYLETYEDRFGDLDETSTSDAIKNIIKGGKDNDGQ